MTTQENLKDIGKEMCENKTVKKVSFTGSTPVAKILMQQASSTLKKWVFCKCYRRQMRWSDFSFPLGFPSRREVMRHSSCSMMQILKRLWKVR